MVAKSCTALKPRLKPWFVGTGNHHSRVSERGCEMDFVHPQYHLRQASGFDTSVKNVTAEWPLPIPIEQRLRDVNHKQSEGVCITPWDYTLGK